jgi:hypothetical protein
MAFLSGACSCYEVRMTGKHRQLDIDIPVGGRCNMEVCENPNDVP